MALATMTTWCLLIRLSFWVALHSCGAWWVRCYTLKFGNVVVQAKLNFSFEWIIKWDILFCGYSKVAHRYFNAYNISPSIKERLISTGNIFHWCFAQVVHRLELSAPAPQWPALSAHSHTQYLAEDSWSWKRPVGISKNRLSETSLLFSSVTHILVLR